MQTIACIAITTDPTCGCFVYGPAWSPDGKWLLVRFVAQATGQHDLFVVALDGSSMMQVTDTPEVEAYTDWGVAP